MKKLDYGMMIVFLVALLVTAFFWKCGFDLTITIIAIVITVITGITTYIQYKKNNELSNKKN